MTYSQPLPHTTVLLLSGASAGRTARVIAVEPRALERHSERAEHFAQLLLPAFGACGQGVVVETLVDVEAVTAVLAGVGVRGHVFFPWRWAAAARVTDAESITSRACAQFAA